MASNYEVIKCYRFFIILLYLGNFYLFISISRICRFKMLLSLVFFISAFCVHFIVNLPKIRVYLIILYYSSLPKTAKGRIKYTLISVYVSCTSNVVIEIFNIVIIYVSYIVQLLFAFYENGNYSFCSYI